MGKQPCLSNCLEFNKYYQTFWNDRENKINKIPCLLYISTTDKGLKGLKLWLRFKG